ncbi:MAG TPA: hypothetical protein VGF77_03715 [Allosphingosinicella sp.]|jgi:hypothetical protein
MKRKLALGLMAGLAAPAAVRAELPTPNKQSLDIYREVHEQTQLRHGEPLDGWEDALVAALGKATPEAAADQLAGRFGLPAPQMRELIRLWLFAETRSDDPTSQQQDELRARFLSLLRASRRSPLVLEAATVGLVGDPGCRDEFQPLLAGSKNPVEDGWRVADVESTCAPLYAHFARLSPSRASPALLATVISDWLRPADKLPLLAYLTSRPALSRIDAAERDAAAKYLTHLYLATLLRAGLTARAIGLYESLTPEWKAAMLAETPKKIAVTADGLPVILDLRIDSVRTGLVAAYAVSGRKADAEALFDSPEKLAAARRNLDCRFANSGVVLPPNAERCDSSRDDGAELLLLDNFLHRPAEDPYPIAEVFYAGGVFGHINEGVFAELACRVFAEPGYAPLCRGGRNATRGFIMDAPGNGGDEPAAKSVIAAAHIPDYDQLKSAFSAQLAAVVARAKGDAGDGRPYRERQAVDPDPPSFTLLTVPEPMRGQAPPLAWSKSFAPLPEGYEPVRIACDGDRVAVISVSQNYDPTGEVSRGGYWVHLSDDGGRSWKRPLYTGLADLFPYVVVPNPRLPLFDGDVLNLAVDIKELDTRSITYPPVGLATRRTEHNLYLRIPIADLKGDTDGDGLTDLAARHLLVSHDSGSQAGATPFIVGRTPGGACTAAGAADRVAMQAILQEIFSLHTGALIEPVDGDPAHALEATAAAMGHIDPNSADRPILVEGDPADFACLRPDRLMIVYSAADLQRLRRMTPDFHAVKLDKIIYDRARDRGYIVWSSGWTGGTIRIRRVGGEWKLETISSWIT